MKIAVTSQGKGLYSEIDPHFGRCSYFIIYDMESEDFEFFDNSAIAASGGAGVQAAQTIVNKKVDVLITGNIGPNAFKVLNAAFIKVYSGISGKVFEAIIKLGQGDLDIQATTSPSVETHSGINRSANECNKKRIAVAAENDKGLESLVSAHFGKCQYYMIIETEKNKIVSSFKVENPYFGDHGVPGRIPAFIKEQNADVIIAGGMGQRAIGFFNDFNIEAVTNASGKVKDVVEEYLQGDLRGYSACKHEEKNHSC